MVDVMDTKTESPTSRARRITREHGPEMAQRYDAGETYAQIAAAFGISKAATVNTVKRHGGTGRGRGYYKDPRMQERAVVVERRYISGETMAAIAESLGISVSTVMSDLRFRQAPRKQTTTYSRARGAESPRWKGGTYINRSGYRVVYLSEDDPLVAMRHKHRPDVFEHRLVMARHLGRTLTASESVHHINGDKLDNRIENLQLRSASHGDGIKLRCHDCGSHNVGAVEL